MESLACAGARKFHSALSLKRMSSMDLPAFAVCILYFVFAFATDNKSKSEPTERVTLARERVQAPLAARAPQGDAQ